MSRKDGCENSRPSTYGPNPSICPVGTADKQIQSESHNATTRKSGRRHPAANPDRKQSKAVSHVMQVASPVIRFRSWWGKARRNESKAVSHASSLIGLQFDLGGPILPTKYCPSDLNRGRNESKAGMHVMQVASLVLSFSILAPCPANPHPLIQVLLKRPHLSYVPMHPSIHPPTQPPS